MTRFPLPPPEPSTTARWSSPEFRAELTDWCGTVLGTPVSVEEHKLRAWSAVWRVRTGGRLLYAKQNCPRQDFEAALVGAGQRDRQPLREEVVAGIAGGDFDLVGFAAQANNVMC